MKSRTVTANQIVFDQADIFQANGLTRITGIDPGGFTFRLHYNGTVKSWALVDGSSITDGQVVSGQVYWSEIGSATGFYSIRWRPDAVGYWHLSFAYAAVAQTSLSEFDVVPAPTSPQGLTVSFTKDL